MDVTTGITLLTEHVHLLTKDQAWHYRVLPKGRSNNGLELLCEDSANQQALADELEILLGQRINLIPTPAAQVARLLSKYYIREHSDQAATNTKYSLNPDDFLVDLVREAKSLRSSDIHIESYENKCRVRIRIDGILLERHLLGRDEYPALINKIKVIARLDIAQKRLPQDGRINFEHGTLKFDIRVSILPTLYGEKVVLRLLNNDAANIDLNTLGFSAHDLENYLDGVRRPNGILLISGPTGSGKTTTLYATLKLLNKEATNIVTIEDPVEYTLQGINQVQLNESIGLTFGSALRTFLRQDPDVIMVGEIRDPDTADMAIRAALTGHLVLSTIHTNSAWGTVSRMIDMGIPSFLVANTLSTTVAQRLVKLLCPHCKEEQQFHPELYPKQFKPFHEVSVHFVPKGCEECHQTGYKGRKAIYEVIPIDQELSYQIRQENMYIQDLLKQRGIQTLAENAFNLFSAGETSLEEIEALLLNF